MRSPRRITPLLATAAALAVVASALAATPAAAAPAAPGALPATAVAQIDALASAKAHRSPTDRKVSSQLLTAATQRAGKAPAAGVGSLATTVTLQPDGRTHVRVALAAGADRKAVAALVTARGGEVRGVWSDSVDADVPLSAVTTLAASTLVARIDPADRATLADAGPAAHNPLQARIARTAAPTPGRADDTTVSEGDTSLATALARSRYHVGGTGITVGVLSDGVSSLQRSIETGELPADTTVLPGQQGQGDEGTAMLEIVHDVAPKAKLLFATAFESADGFAANIRALRAAGADIIVDDVIYYAESPFQDGPLAQAVSDVIADGAEYFSSAGNQGNLDDRTSGTWEGDFVSSGQSLPKYVGKALDFAPGAVVQASNPLSDFAAGTVTTLFWADPLGRAKDDYDLYVLDATGRVVAMSNDTQDGDDDPFEALQVPYDSGLRLAVVKYAGADRYLQVTTFGGQFTSANGLTGYATAGAIRGHAAVPAAYAVAAAPAATALPFAVAPGVKNPTGPFPGSYTRTQKSEAFSSDGPRRVFFTPDGRALTPGNTTTTGGQVRQKPDITSADGTSSSIFGFDPFFGTSAAAPHAAALAALVLSGNPGLSPSGLRSALTSSAIDIEDKGWDRDTGYGIPTGTRTLATTGTTPQPLVQAGTPTVAPAGTTPRYLEPGETSKVLVPLTNNGDGAAANVNVAVTSTNSKVTPALVQVGSIPAGATKNAAVTVTVPRTLQPGDPVAFAVTVRFTGSLSPTTHSATVAVGRPATTPQTFAYTGPVVPIPDGDPTGVSVPLVVSGVRTISAITFSIDGTDCSTDAGAGIQHTAVYDLVARLTGPDGRSVSLFNRMAGFHGHNFCQTVLDDSAPTSIQNEPDFDAPFTGRYQPDEPLKPFLGTNGDGTWTFTVHDDAAGDTGVLHAVSLHLSGYTR
ncbi:S8 family serine peptidase [Jatrophihabitans sp. YIM 134969]